MKNLKKKLKNLSLAQIGNRAVLAGNVVGMSSAYCLFRNFFPEIPVDEIVCSLGLFLAGSIQMSTRGGYGTQKSYNIAKRKIQETGGIHFDWARSHLGMYCNNRWLYLAAKEEGLLDQFRNCHGKYAAEKEEIDSLDIEGLFADQ